MQLRLHYGAAPQWLLSRMTKLAEGIFTVIVEEKGVKEVLVKLSDPLFFQACSNVLGFDWDSSGSTTVTSSVLKRVFGQLDLGVKAVGGKGGRSRETPSEITRLGETFNVSTGNLEKLKYASRMTAKVDCTAIQAGYQIYHHMMFISEKGEWTVVQQGLNVQSRTARRYHWLGIDLKSLVDEPHSGIIGDKAHPYVLDMTAKASEENRKVSVDLVNQPEEKIKTQYSIIRNPVQMTLNEEPRLNAEAFSDIKLPEKVNWKALHEAYETKPKNYEEIIAIRGVGPATVRGLALVSELIYGAKPSWRDPLKFSFAFGGKDGIPFPLKRRSMDKAITILKDAVESAELGNRDKFEALKRLRRFAPETVEFEK